MIERLHERASFNRVIEKYISPQEEASLRSFSGFKRIHFLPSNEPTLEGLTRKFTASLEKDWNKKTHIFYLDGLPNTGKSYFRRKMSDHLELLQDRMLLEGKHITIRQYSWDIVEEELVDGGIITPEDRNKPFKPEELDVVNVYFNTLLASTLRKDETVPWQSLKNSLVDTKLLQPRPKEKQEDFYIRLVAAYLRLQKRFDFRHEDISKKDLVLLIEKPGATAYRYPDGTWEETERRYASQTLDYLTNGVHPYDGITRDDIYIAAVGCVGGPSMKNFGIYRNQLKNILSGSAPLKTANALNRHFGLPLFRNTDEVREHARGATPVQTVEAKLEMWRLIQKLAQNHEESFLNNLPEYLKLFIYGHQELGYDTRLLSYITLMMDQNLESRDRWQELLEQVNETREVADRLSNGSNGKLIQEELSFARMLSICYNLAGAALLENLDTPDIKIVLYNNPSLRTQRKRS